MSRFQTKDLIIPPVGGNLGIIPPNWFAGSGRDGPDPAFPPLFRENPASRTFFISFPNPDFLSQKNTLRSLVSTKADKCKM